MSIIYGRKSVENVENNKNNSLTKADALDIFCDELRHKAAEIRFGTMSFECKLEIHDARIKQIEKFNSREVHRFRAD